VCNKEAPSVEAAKQKFGDKVTFVGVSWTGTDDAEYQGFVDKYKLSFPQILDPGDGSLFAHFKVPSQPAWILMRADGSFQQLSGAVDEGQLSAMLGGLST
jgi:AhpC/TSA family